MIAPPGLLAASIVFWGWQCDLMLIALLLAVLLEAWRVTTTRWDFTSRDHQRIADFCTWVFVFLTGYYVVSKGWPLPILLIVQWLPLVLAPLVLAQLYGPQRGIELCALFLSLRSDHAGVRAHARVDLTFAFVVVCALTAGAANVRDEGYYAGITILALWALWCVRGRRYGLKIWVPVCACAIAFGYAGHVGLNRLQIAIFNLAIEYLQLDLARTDPYRASTDIGHIGSLKSSSTIMLRVDLPRDVAAPVLLHRASYNAYAAPSWVARDAAFEPIHAQRDEGVRLANDQAASVRRYVVSEVFKNGAGVLALPDGTQQVAGIEAASTRRNRLASVRVERAPGPITYTALAADAPLMRDAPSELDLRVPARERPALEQALAQIAAAGTRGDRFVAALQRYFGEHFRYSTYRAERVETDEAIGEFLLRSRAGHCEYFATATVLLARAAGIPARYSTGFAVQEWSEIERRYVVRERHAHAWASLYIDGRWRFVDTTPPQWFDVESEDAPFWERAADVWAWLAHRYEDWRNTPAGNATPPWLIVTLIVLVAVLVVRLARGGGFKRMRGRSRVEPERLPHIDAHAAFYRIEAYIAEHCGARGRAETLAEWLNRVRLPVSDDEAAELHSLLRRHYRLRFDPRPASATEQARVATDSAAWLARVASQLASHQSS